jgi:hypothetical protein
VEVSVLQRHLVIDPNLCIFHIRHIYMFSSELKPRITMKLPISRAVARFRSVRARLCPVYR